MVYDENYFEKTYALCKFHFDIIELFSYYKLDRNDSVGIQKFNNSKKLPPVGLELMQEIITGSGVPCLTNCTKLAYAS